MSANGSTVMDGTLGCAGAKFDGDLAIQPRVMRQVDDAHPAAPELGDDRIRAELGARGERVIDAGGEYRQLRVSCPSERMPGVSPS